MGPQLRRPGRVLLTAAAAMASRSRNRCARSVRLGCHDLRRAAGDDRRDERRRQPAGHRGTRRHRRPRRVRLHRRREAATTSCAAAAGATLLFGNDGGDRVFGNAGSRHGRRWQGRRPAVRRQRRRHPSPATRRRGVQTAVHSPTTTSPADLGQDTVGLLEAPEGPGKHQGRPRRRHRARAGQRPTPLDRGRVRRQRARRRTRVGSAGPNSLLSSTRSDLEQGLGGDDRFVAGWRRPARGRGRQRHHRHVEHLSGGLSLISGTARSDDRARLPRRR